MHTQGVQDRDLIVLFSYRHHLIIRLHWDGGAAGRLAYMDGFRWWNYWNYWILL